MGLATLVLLRDNEAEAGGTSAEDGKWFVENAWNCFPHLQPSS